MLSAFPRPSFVLRLAVASLALAAACSSPRRAQGGVPATAIAHAPRICDFDVEHYAIDLELQPAIRSIEGSCTVRLWPRVDSIERVALDLLDLEVRGVRDQRGRALGFQHEDGVLEILLAEPLRRDDFVELAIRYGGAPKLGLWFSGERDGIPTQVFTQGECEDARRWFPCWDVPYDRATSEVRVELPEGWISTAAGELVDRVELDAGGSIEHWRMTTPHPPYLTTLVAGEFARVESRWEDVPLTFLAAPDRAEALERCFQETDEMLAFFSDVTGFRYPYAKYSQACVDNFPFGGMENISATTMTDEMLRDELGLRDSPTEDLIAHEAAHQWFGDLMTCADWSHIWLNEGFASYFDLLYVEASDGKDAFREQVRKTQESYLAADVGKSRRPTIWNVWREPMDLFFGGQTYAGGAARLHALRGVVGDGPFFRGVREYVASNAGRSVVTDDLQRAMERATGEDLSWFFDQWLRQRGYPEFRVRHRWLEDEGAVEIVVEQVQDVADGTPAVFRAPVELEVQLGAETLVERVVVDERRESFRIAAREKPRWVHFDHHGWVPKRCEVERPLEEWLALAAGDGDVNVRRDAVAALVIELREARDDDSRLLIVSALLDRARNDARPSVREAAATALRVSAASASRDTLVALATQDASAHVRVAALDSLATFGPDAELAELAERAFAEPYSHATRVAAVRLRCAAAPKDARAFVDRCLRERTRNGELESGLLAVLAMLERERAAPELIGWLEDGSAPDRMRATAAKLVGLHGRNVAGARQALERALTSTRVDLRAAALEGLGSLKDPHCVPALRALSRQTLDSRHRRALERLLDADWARG